MNYRPADDIAALITAGEIRNILHVVYVHRKLSNGGDLYLTRYGVALGPLLDIENWYEPAWFEAKRQRLDGTSYVYKVPTKTVNDRSLNLVVKYSRVGEQIPVNTKILHAFVNTEFNSPWEEFSLVMEMREGGHGPRDLHVRTQRPLAIYVPPGQMQLWQTGRSRAKINKVIHQHPGVTLDILCQYIMVYEWIEGLNVVDLLRSFGYEGAELDHLLEPISHTAVADMDAKGFIVADMKPTHIIVDEHRVEQMQALVGEGARERRATRLHKTIQRHDFSVIDYELLLRTPPYEAAVKRERRHNYLDDQQNRFKVSPIPAYLRQTEVFGVPLVHGHAESTGGMLWVVGCNARLFDYFLPERWRKTPCRALSQRREVFYTLTKDNIHLVWRTSQVGETPDDQEYPDLLPAMRERGFNSPFEECAIAHHLSQHGVPTTYMRAIYMTGTAKVESVTDPRRFATHRGLEAMDGTPLLREDRNYVTIRGYFNGTDAWVASHEGPFCKPYDLLRASQQGILPREDCRRLLETICSRLLNLHFDGGLLQLEDVLIAVQPDGNLLVDAEGKPETRICNFEMIGRV